MAHIKLRTSLGERLILMLKMWCLDHNIKAQKWLFIKTKAEISWFKSLLYYTKHYFDFIDVFIVLIKWLFIKTKTQISWLIWHHGSLILLNIVIICKILIRFYSFLPPPVLNGNQLLYFLNKYTWTWTFKLYIVFIKDAWNVSMNIIFSTI